jgi:hypothetical protein
MFSNIPNEKLKIKNQELPDGNAKDLGVIEPDGNS